MGKLTQIIPTNLLEQREKFFTNQNFNPVFTYVKNFQQMDLLKYGQPLIQLTELSEEILTKSYSNASEADLFQKEGDTLTQNQVTEQVSQYLDLYGLTSRFQVNWSRTQLVRTVINEDSINLRLPCDFRSEGLLGMLYHEIGTHALRRVNYERQSWYKKKKHFGFQQYLRTEEGLASLHSLYAHSFQLNYIDAIRYLAVWTAQRGSFLEVWNALKPFVDDLDRRWMITVRAKRGLTDTAAPGGLTKDKLYLEGSVFIWHWLMTNQMQLDELYAGKIAAEDISLAQNIGISQPVVLPDFYTENRVKYGAIIERIGLVNSYDQVDISSLLQHVQQQSAR